MAGEPVEWLIVRVGAGGKVGVGDLDGLTDGERVATCTGDTWSVCVEGAWGVCVEVEDLAHPAATTVARAKVAIFKRVTISDIMMAKSSRVGSQVPDLEQGQAIELSQHGMNIPADTLL